MKPKYLLPLNYDYKYLTDLSKGYRKSQLFNSALPSTYNENYRFKRRSIRDDAFGALLIVIGLILYFLLGYAFIG